jgi:hypothetical protein
MQNLLGKNVRVSVTVFGQSGPEPDCFTGKVEKIEGTMILFSNCKQFGEKLNDTWHNTSSVFFNWIQVL